MKINKLGKLTSWLLIFALIFGFIIPQTSHAETIPATGVGEATTITDGKVIDSAFEQPGVKWYKITPTKDEITKYSHLKIEINSDQVVNVSVYSSKENAEKDQTFEQYSAGTIPGTPAIIQFPYAWDNTYYIKVEYYGLIENPDGTVNPDASLEGADFGNASYTLKTSSVKLPPSTEDSAGASCPVESSVNGKSSAKEMLKDLRLFRDGILSKTEQGRQLSSLYYKSAPFLIMKLAFNKNMQEDIYDNLVVLQPLINDLNINGASSSRVISKSEAKAINALYKIANDAVPTKLKTEMESLSKKANLTNLAGESVVDVANRLGIKLPQTSSGKYIVKLKDGKTLSSVQSKIKGSSTLSTLSVVDKQDELFDNMYVVKLNNQKSGLSAKAQATSLLTTVSQVKKLPEVEFVEPVQTYHALSNDIQSFYQWSLKNSGGDEGLKGADIRNDKLQSLLSKQNVKDTVIAVVDTGVDYTLADLKNRVRTDIGKNFVDKDQPPLDDNGHGTHVSGIIAAESNNGYSMEGIDQKAKIMPVKVLDASGSGDTEQIAYGIKYAVDHGAKVINLSLGGKYSRVLEYALKYAASRNVVVVAASGNDGQYGISYPGSSQYVISVGATNTLDIVSDYSNYGEKLDLVAPGTNIPSIVPNGNVTYMSGTSMATPHVAAVAGLLLSENPKLKVADIRKILHESSDKVAFEEKDNKDENSSILDMIGSGVSGMDPEDFDLPIGSDLVSGFGRLNAFSAVSTADLKVKVNPITEKKTSVTGNAIKGAKVEVKKGSKVIGKATASSKGTFSVKIPAQKINQKLLVTISDSTGLAKSTLTVYVEKDKSPAAPKVNTISNKTTYVTGKTKAKQNVVIKNASKKVIAQGKVNSKGQFKIKIKKQKAGTKLYITSVDSAKRSSKAVKVVVKDKIAPASPKVNTVTSNTTTVKGKAEKGSTMTVKAKSKTIGKAKVDNKGNFAVKINKQKAGTSLYVTAKDKVGNTSKAKKVIVKG
ncbi:S8 family serine peptidase [Rummeliibacillus sp. NPDC094406]|uniref:S8 family serine peptidase n=1 Tax=Rummeliibacillus sp. NPDC094406 TaxID=3364511 RepID=UPI003806B12A